MGFLIGILDDWSTGVGRALAGVLMGVGTLACAPELDNDLSLIERPRVIALRSEPAEAAPGESVTLSALVAAPDGTLVDAVLDWSFCIARRPLAELGPIAPQCVTLVEDPDAVDEAAVTAIGEGATIDAALPEDGCRLFGPEPPPAMPGEPTGRPVDPDATGGYYQPILVRLLDESPSLELLRTRLACGLTGATQAQSAEYTLRYQRNIAPAIAGVARIDGGEVELLGVDPIASVGVGERIELRVRWTDCPSEPSCGDQLCSLDEVTTCTADCEALPGCLGAETHVYFDPLELRVATRREGIGVTWYTTAGRLDEARTGRATDELEPTSDNGWQAPDEPGLVHFWVVLRDDRGGTGWASFDLQVE